IRLASLTDEEEARLKDQKSEGLVSARRGVLSKADWGRRLASYDTVVIGGGPGGYVAAIKAAQLGQK
ncbi:962_t:CDS:2, partial [Acaulospora colombiana]